MLFIADKSFRDKSSNDLISSFNEYCPFVKSFRPFAKLSLPYSFVIEAPIDGINSAFIKSTLDKPVEP